MKRISKILKDCGLQTKLKKQIIVAERKKDSDIKQSNNRTYLGKTNLMWWGGLLLCQGIMDAT